MAGRVPRRHREDPDEGGPDLPEDLREARWWYLVAGPPLVVVLSLVTGLALVPFLVVLDPGLSGALVFLWLVLVWGFGLAAALALPVGLYADTELIDNVWSGWAPDRDRYVAVGALAPALWLGATLAGLVLESADSGLLYGFVLGTGTALTVSLLYLVRRRRHLDVP